MKFLSLPKIVIIALILYLVLLDGCRTGEPTPPPTELVPTPDPMFATPQVVLQEDPWQGAPKIPDVLLLTAPQDQQELASFLRTTVIQLTRVNPGLPDPVPSGTLVAIPYNYQADLGETVTTIAEKTGLSEEVWLAYNPALRDQVVLAAGTVLVMPQLLIVAEETALTAAADQLAISQETLLWANPNLAGEDKLLAGTVLVVPPTENR